MRERAEYTAFGVGVRVVVAFGSYYWFWLLESGYFGLMQISPMCCVRYVCQLNAFYVPIMAFPLCSGYNLIWWGTLLDIAL